MEAKEVGPQSPILTPAAALRAKYTLPHYILLFEVRDSTGFDSTRSADAICVSLYASRGREVSGFEIKASRSDWLRELKQPEKAEEIGKFCDYFWLVTQDESIARLEEIPGPWGWMAVKGQRLKILKKADKLQPVALDRPMLCSLLYALRQQCLSEIDKQIGERVSERVASEQTSIRYSLEQAERRSESDRKLIDDFERESGLRIRYGNIPKIGAAVRRVIEGEDIIKKFKADLDWVVLRARGVATEVERQLAQIEKEQAASTGAPSQ